MDRHLNVFFPYERPAQHEDQLTRAAMIVMRAVPLARDAMLSRIGVRQSGRLPAPELDIQAARVAAAPAGQAGEDGPGLRELVSVFLSPDEGLDLSAATVAEREGGQRLDGVLRFGGELAVVIESKIVGRAPTAQAEQLRLFGMRPELPSRVVALGWHELLGDWWALLESGLLAPAERVLVEDLFALAEEHFAHLLPFTTLRRAGEHDLRLRRRLVALLRQATGLEDAEPGRDRHPSATVKLDAAGASSTQRITLWQNDGELQLSSWPAELKPQAAALYQADTARRLLDFLALNRGAWHAVPKPHLAYYTSSPDQRLYLTCGLGTGDYVRLWQGEGSAVIGSHAAALVPETLWPWLIDHRCAAPGDDLDAFLRRLAGRPALLRPGIRIWRSWTWQDAARLDEDGKLAGQVRAAAAELLTALGEPLPPACAVTQP